MALEDMTAAAPPMDGAAPPADDMAPAGKVLATILENEDGTYTLETGEGEGAKSSDFESPGELLKAILDLCKGGANGGKAQESFEAGFGGESDQKQPA